MSDQITPAEHRRCVALEAAGRCAEPGMTTSGLLSRAFQCETYLVTGLIRTGPKWQNAAEVGTEHVSVMVEGPDLQPSVLADVARAVRAVL
jgi:hypothetical protein